MRVLIIGAALSGRAAAGLARSLGYDVVLYDRSDAVVEGLASEDVQVAAGEWHDSLLDGVDLVITSPGVPEHAPPIAAAGAAGLTVWSELEFGTRNLDVPYVAVTGTNGKTTVTSTAAAMLVASGVDSVAAGNIGTPVCTVVGSDVDVVVVEASSFQLRFIDRFHPSAAAVVNLAPDHLDWHRTFADYADAKARIFEHMTGGEVLGYDADDEGATGLVSAATARLVPASGSRVPPGGVGRDGDRLVVGEFRYPLPTEDPSYLVDLALAAVLAGQAGATGDGIGSAIAAFSPGSHRRQVVASSAGITWIDDSKATNPHAARAAASAYESVVLIAGGRNKGLDLAGMVAPSVRHVVGYGEAGPGIASATSTESTVVERFDDAVEAAARFARPGDVVLLAPGCASFDQFDSYEERGDRFAELARQGSGVAK